MTEHPSDFTFHFHSLENEMATQSSVLAWRISGMGEPGGLSSTGSHRVRHNQSNSAAAAAAALGGRAQGCLDQWLYDMNAGSVTSDSLRPHGL